MRRQGGFTILEVLMVTVIIAIIATIALPLLLASRIDANESAAISTLRTLVQAQLSFAARRDADLNENGNGEFGTFGEMSGNVAVRAASGGTRFLSPTVVNPSFRLITPLGEMQRSGYVYRLYLPGAGGVGVTELAGGGASTSVDADLAETTWCVYAWPQRVGVTGRRTFFTNQSGDILFTSHPLYSGLGAPIPAGAALAEPGAASSIVGPIAVGTTARDGNVWRPHGT
ncbi:MAG: DUF2950 family protein [Planctomycetaceae bacterium]